MGTGVSVLLAFVLVISGLAGIFALTYGPAFIGLLWWIMALIALIGISALNYLSRIARAAEKSANGS